MEPFHAYELTLTQGSRERGLIHGETLRAQIVDAVDGFAEALKKAGKNPEAIAFSMVHEYGYLAAAERWTPWLVEEIRGIADGAGLPFERIMAWQLVQEMAWVPQLDPSAAPLATACTSLGSWTSTGSTIVAQTVDGTGWGHGRELITHLTDPETAIRAHVIGWPGHVGVYGLNDHGIGICCNSMFIDVTNSTVGLSALFTVRGVLAQRTLDDADRFIRGVSHASGTNFMIGGPGRAVSYEVSAKGIAAYEPSPDSRITYHTNHVIANADRVAPNIPGWDTNTKARLASVERRMNERNSAMTWEDAREVISSHDDEENPICRHFTGDAAAMTLYGLVMECSAERPVIHIATGPPCCTEFRAFGF
ncbi:MAG TPA: C45 family peptidase [Chloroflexota bacterium]|nr:C45 family peptidase [Chloroflexota bacterium]